MEQSLRITHSMTKARNIPKRPPIMPLDQIPHQIQFKILFKLPITELIRMRRTCTYIDSMVENNKEKFSARVGFDIDATVTVGLEKRKEKFKLECLSMDFSRKRYISYNSPFEKMFSGVSLKHLTMYENGSILAGQQAEMFLQKLKLTCEKLTIDCDFSIQQVVRCADLVQCKLTKIDRMHRETEDSIPILLQGKNRSTYCFSVEDADILLNHFDELKNFKGISSSLNMTTTASQFKSFLLLLKNTTDFGGLEKIGFCFPNASDAELLKTPFSSFPPTKLLWNRTGNPPYLLRKVDFIRQLDLANGKCALIVKNSIEEYEKFKIRLVDNSAEKILASLIYELRIEVNMKKRNELLAMSEEDRKQELEKLYTWR